MPGPKADLPAVTADAAARYDAHVLAVELSQGLAAVWDIVDAANKYLVEKEPWKLAKDPAAPTSSAAILYAWAETLRILAVLDPADHARRRPAAVGAARASAGASSTSGVPDAAAWGRLAAGHADDEGRGALPAASRPTTPRRAHRLQSRVRLRGSMFHVKLPRSTVSGDPCRLAAVEREEP